MARAERTFFTSTFSFRVVVIRILSSSGAVDSRP